MVVGREEAKLRQVTGVEVEVNEKIRLLSAVDRIVGTAEVTRDEPELTVRLESTWNTGSGCSPRPSQLRSSHFFPDRNGRQLQSQALASA